MFTSVKGGGVCSNRLKACLRLPLRAVVKRNYGDNGFKG